MSLLIPINRQFCEEKFAENKEVIVVFEKKNGDLRTMHCTTNLECIPEESHPKGEPKNIPAKTFNVWDMEAEGWRSFTISKVISMEEYKNL